MSSCKLLHILALDPFVPLVPCSPLFPSYSSSPLLPSCVLLAFTLHLLSSPPIAHIPLIGIFCKNWSDWLPHHLIGCLHPLLHLIYIKVRFCISLNNSLLNRWASWLYDKAKVCSTRKHSGRMRTDRALTRMSSDRVAMRPIVDRMTDACENITFPCGR